MSFLHPTCKTLLAVLALLLASLAPFGARAADWVPYDLAGMRFSVPSDWEITYAQRDVALDFQSPDGTFQLWVAWWFPDEPLTGFDDIVYQDVTTIAGHTAFLIRHENQHERVLQIALPAHKNADGEIPLIQLIAPIDLSVANHVQFMHAVAEKLFIDGQQAGLRRENPFGAAPGQEPVADDSGQTVLFDGRRLDGWDTLGVYGGNFESDAQLGPEMLSVAVGKGRGWALAGLRSLEPIVSFPARAAQEAQMLRAELDFGATDGMLLAFADPQQITDEPWSNYDLRLHAYLGNDGQGRYRLDVKGGQAVTAAGPWPKSEGVGHFTATLRPDGLLILRNGNGSELLRAEVPQVLQGKPWHLRAYVRPAAKNAAASMALRQLVMQQVAPKAEPDPDRIATEPTETVLFDGSGTGALWQHYEAYDNYFGRHAVVDGGLIIDRAPETDNVRIGLMSAEPVLWLDRFRGDGQARLTFSLDGGHATGFELLLSQRIGYDKNAQHGVRLWFEREPETGKVALHAISPQMPDGLVVPGLADIPDRFALVLRPGRIAIEIDGIAPQELPFAAAQDGAGLRLYVMGRNLPGSDETHLTLNRITANRRPGTLPAPALPRPGVAPLPVKELLAFPLGTEWQRQAPGGLDFEALSQALGQGIRLFREEGPNNNNRIALVSDAAVVHTDRRITRTPLGVTFRLDPADPDLAGRIVMASGVDPLNRAVHEVILGIVKEGAQAGRLRLELFTDHFSYHHWARHLPVGWHQDVWDGTVALVLGDGLIRVTLGTRDGADVSMTAQTSRSRAGQRYHIGLMPGTRATYLSGGITVLGIEAGWLTPDGMDALTRQELVDTKDFSPAAYLTGLKILIDEEIGQ